jgi:pimeloyl-ACP methyl ester carboxylesterase
LLVARFVEPALKGALSHVGGGVDLAALHVVLALTQKKHNRIAELEARRPYWEAMARAYAALDPAEFYATPPPIAPRVKPRPRSVDGGTVLDLTWPSGYEPRWAEARADYERWRENATSHVRLFRHAKHAPAVICIHGFGGGAFFIEEQAWQVSRLFALGLDVALFTLPFHGRRAPRHWGAPMFPVAEDIGRTNEGFGQAIWDLRGLMAWLRAEGAPAVGVAGMSLGAYTTALLATVEPQLDFAIKSIPMADITDAVVAHDRMRGLEIDVAIQNASRQALAIHTPLMRAPVIDGARVLVMGAEQDRITGHWQAAELARHFGGALRIVGGSHLFHLGRRETLQSIQSFLNGSIANWTKSANSVP